MQAVLLHNTAKRQGSLFRTHRISRTYHRAEVSCTRTDYLYQQHPDKAFDETQDVDDLMQEAEGKLFEISQQNMKKDYTQINPVIQEAYEMLQKRRHERTG